MLVLYSFGDVVEQYFHYYFPTTWIFLYLILYVAGIIISTLFSYFRYKNNPAYNAVGASGAVSAVLFASILFYPTGKIYMFFIPIPIPAFIFGALYLLYSYIMARRNRDNIGHDAHFWGAVFGIAFTIICRPSVALEFWRQIQMYIGI